MSAVISRSCPSRSSWRAWARAWLSPWPSTWSSYSRARWASANSKVSDWPDALLNAGLVVTGNGPITRMQTALGKVFLLVYAIVGVIVFAAVISVVLAPVLHRALHAFHVEVPDEERRS